MYTCMHIFWRRGARGVNFLTPAPIGHKYENSPPPPPPTFVSRKISGYKITVGRKNATSEIENDERSVGELLILF